MTGILTTTILSFILYAVLVGIIIANNKKTRVRTSKIAGIIFIVLFIIGGIMNYMILLPITIPNMVISNLVIGAAGILLLYGMSASKFQKKARGPYEGAIGLIIILAVLAIPTILILGVFTLDNTYESIAKEEVMEAEPIDKEATPIAVSPEYARNKMQKSMGVVPNPQFYDLGKLQAQKIDGEFVFVAPLEFTGFWKYFRGKETAGYFKISATNINAQPEFIKSKMRYTNSSYLNQNIQRTVYGAYPNYIQSGKAQIEVDEDGKPWYIQTIYQPIGLTNKPDMSDLYVAVVDPVTGDVTKYKTDKAPEFIDGPVSSEMASRENEYFGKYVHGWLNSIFGKKDVKIPNESGTESSVTPIFDKQGDMYYFTDMASPKENIDSALGYTLINARTGELTYYNGKKNNGIMDSKGAKEIVNKQFPEKNWKGSMPVLYNIDGVPTWVVNVLDPNGLFKKYAYIKAGDADFAVFGDTAKETLQAYRLQLAQDPSNVESSGEAELETIEGQVNRVLVTTQKNGQVIQFLLKGDRTIYTVNAGKAPLALFLQPGDNVTLKVNLRNNGTGIVDSIEIKQLKK